MAAGAAAAAAIAQALKASGIVVRLEPGEFMKVLRRAPNPLVVIAQGGIFKPHYRYLMSYKGLAFHTKTAEPIELSADVEVVEAAKIWMPD
jgi:ABC-type transport system substrate-binding protein